MVTTALVVMAVGRPCPETHAIEHENTNRAPFIARVFRYSNLLISCHVADMAAAQGLNGNKAKIFTFKTWGTENVIWYRTD